MRLNWRFGIAPKERTQQSDSPKAARIARNGSGQSSLHFSPEAIERGIDRSWTPIVQPLIGLLHAEPWRGRGIELATRAERHVPHRDLGLLARASSRAQPFGLPEGAIVNWVACEPRGLLV